MITVSKCLCKTCKFAHRYDQAKATKNFVAMSKLVKDVMKELCCVGEDAAVMKCILDGKWPSARRHLTEALVKCPPESEIAESAGR